MASDATTCHAFEIPLPVAFVSGLEDASQIVDRNVLYSYPLLGRLHGVASKREGLYSSLILKNSSDRCVCSVKWMVNRASTEPRCTQDQILRFRADRMIPPNAVMAVSDTLPSRRAAGVTANGAVDTESAAIARAVFVLTFLEPTESDKGTVRHTAPSGWTDHISRL
jgi:hypothetical protein